MPISCHARASARHLLSVIVLGGLLLTGPPSSALEAAPADGPPPKLVLVSWDGAGDVLIDRLLAEGRLPHLARWVEHGARAVHVVGTVPSKTAPSHASIYTGCGPAVHGVGSNSTVHAADPATHTALESHRGFSATALRAEPLFTATARQGLDTLVLAASHYVPHDALERWLPADLPLSRYRSFSSFEDRILGAHAWSAEALGPSFTLDDDAADDGDWTDLPPHRGPVREIELSFRGPAPGTPIHALAYDAVDENDEYEGLDRVLIRIGSKGADATAQAILRPHPPLADDVDPAERRQLWSPPLEIRGRDNNGGKRAQTLFRLFELAPDGSRMVLYQRKASDFAGRFSADDRQRLAADWKGSFDDPFRPYLRGHLGRPLPAGGDGEAEKRLIEIVALDADLLVDSTRRAWQRWQPRALFHYQPMTDHAAHAWMGAIDPTSPYYDPEIGPRLWQVYARLVAHADRWLGALTELGGENTVLALVSDHGMTWVEREFFPNRILEQAGLVVRDDDGEIDLSRSRAFAAELEFAVRINDRRWQGGTVAPEERQQILRRATDALLAARDPETGRPLVHRVFGADQLGHPLPGDEAADPAQPDLAQPDLARPDLFFDPAPGYYPRLGFEDPLARKTRAPWGNGSHGYWPANRSMHAILYLLGPGIRSGVEIPAIRQIDIAPTLAHLLGIDPPADTCGRVAFEALAVPTPAPAPAPAR